MTRPEEALQSLLAETPVASLGVLEEGAPSVSLVPFVRTTGPTRLWLLVSALSPHTAALRADARCAVMVHASPQPDDARSNHALVRLSLRCTARFVSRDEGRDEGVEAMYRARFPVAETLLGLGDFHWVELTPVDGAGRFVQGFGRAYTVGGADLDALTHDRGR